MRVYDIADLYKAEHDSAAPEAEARRSFREELWLYWLLPRIVADIQSLLSPGEAAPLPDGHGVEMVNLWDPVVGSVAAGVNYAGEEIDDAL